jgi:hypothetical protein
MKQSLIIVGAILTSAVLLLPTALLAEEVPNKAEILARYKEQIELRRAETDAQRVKERNERFSQAEQARAAATPIRLPAVNTIGSTSRVIRPELVVTPDPKSGGARFSVHYGLNLPSGRLWFWTYLGDQRGKLQWTVPTEDRQGIYIRLNRYELKDIPKLKIVLQDSPLGDAVAIFDLKQLVLPNW